MEKETKKTGRIATYATIMLLMVVLIIIIAAMADNREQDITSGYESQLDESTRVNASIQEQITGLSNENYELKEQIKTLEGERDAMTADKEYADKLSEISRLLNDDKKDEAKAAYDALDKDNVPESTSEFLRLVTDSLKAAGVID
ncbi:MAG: hypothetical protein Q4E94_00930 [Clostridia bacterium]|nr:hypothetical protein [Clostridia bacterium]